MSTTATPDYPTTIAPEHRKKYGQFFTPDAVAAFMCQWVLGGKSNEIFDPAFGLGAFYKAARGLKTNIGFRGFEVDAVVLDHFHQSEKDQKALSLTHADYL